MSPSRFMHPIAGLSPVRRGGAVATLLALGLLAACGGGGSTAGADSSATAASYALGPITGYGSIVVNGVHYDERNASVEDDDGNRHGASELKLGMVVEVQAGAVDDAAQRATASHVRFGSELKGPVAALSGDNSAGTITMLDQTITVSSNTVWDSTLAGGMTRVAELLAAAQASGATVVLEVHAQFDSATGRYAATRIELEDGASSYRLRGTVSSLNIAATTFQIGNAVINYGGVPTAELPGNLADGLKVRVRLATAKVNNQWVATRVTSGVRRVEDHNRAHLRGTVGTVISPTSFTVEGITVDASGARWPDGSSGLTVGARVEVEGSLANGVLMATKVEFDSRHGDDDDRNKPEFEGKVASVNKEALTFTIAGRTETISYAGAVRYDNGGLSDLKVGASVEVKGRIAPDGTIVARKIEFK